jgi:hypothetical protein
MPNWKDDIQVRDLASGQRLEMTCCRCGHLRYLSHEMLMTKRSHQYLRLSEVEKRARCKVRGCNGGMRMAMLLEGRTTGFVGGLA